MCDCQGRASSAAGLASIATTPWRSRLSGRDCAEAATRNTALELAASTTGVKVAGVKLTAFGLSAFYAGTAGALLAHLGRSLSAERFQLDLSIQYLSMIVIGGLGSVRGSLLGATFIMLLPIAQRWVVTRIEGVLPAGASARLSSFQLVMFGLVIVGSTLLQPRGLANLRLGWVFRSMWRQAFARHPAAPLSKLS